MLGVRVLIAPDCFGGTLSAAEVANAIARGWWRSAPDDELVLRPLADGGPGFVEVLHVTLGGTLHERTVTGPLGSPVPARWLAHQRTGYLESAQACGLHLVPPERRDAGAATTRGVGELVAAAREAGMARVIIGLGGSATTDGGAGMLAALGAAPVDQAGAPLPDGGAALSRCARLAGEPALDDLELVAAADVTHPLLGPHGAAKVFGPQKGADPQQVAELEAALARWADVLAAATGRDVREEPGAGAAGGLGAALLALGASRQSGAAVVRVAVGLDAELDRADLVVTGEGSFDTQSLRGKLAAVVAAGAAERGVPCLVLAGQVRLDPREAAAAGVQAFAVAEHAGSVDAALADPAGTLAALAEHAAERRDVSP